MEDKLTFVKDFFIDIDSGVSADEASEYVCEEIEMDVNGIISRGKEEFKFWFDSISAGYEKVFHKITNAAVSDQGIVMLEITWMGALKNIGDENRVRHSLRVDIYLNNENGQYKIRKYISRVVG